jgi:cytidylate kinase
MPPPCIVTIERMVACGGLYIGRKVAEALRVPCLDQEILTRAARELQRDERQLRGRDERLLSFGQKLLAAFSAGSPDAEYVPPTFPLPEDHELFAAEKRVILDAVEQGGAVVIGHGGAAILGGRPNVVKVFCHAPLACRTRRLMQLYRISDRREALRAVMEQDRARERYLRAVTGRNWRDADQYDLCIDTSTAGFELATGLILALARNENRTSDQEFP